MSCMAKRTSFGTPGKSVETLTHEEARRKNIPTAEYQAVLAALPLGYAFGFL